MTNQKITEMTHFSDQIYDNIVEIKKKTTGKFPILKIIVAIPLIVKTIEDIVVLIKKLLEEMKNVE